MSSHQTRGARLLVVEDEAIVALLEKKTLEKYGYEVITSYSGEQAVETATQDTRISLLLMDIDLGSGIDGTEAARQILQARSLPIVFLTGHSEKEYVDRVKEITSYGYVLKNSGEFVLTESIEMAFNLYEANNELKRQRENLRSALIQQEKTGEALQEGRKQLETIFNSARDAIYIHDLDGTFLEVNNTACEQLGYSKSELRNMTVLDIDNPVHRRPGTDIKDQLQRDHMAYLETEHITKSGESFPVELSLVLIDYYGMPAVLGVARDISNRKEVEEKLQEMYSRLQTVIDSVPFLINEIDLTGRYLLVNEATCKLVGLSKEQLIGKHFREVLPQDTANTFQDRVEHVCAGGEQLTVDDRLDLGGKQRVFRTVLTPVLQDESTIHSIVSIAYDVSQQVTALHQKDLLMRELNHRVKNNLLMVSSLIDLKDAALGCEVDLSDLRNQVNAIEKVHKSLQESDDITHINLKSYVTDILAGIFQTSPSRDVAIDSDIPDIAVGTIIALPLGLIINETATNALKHGFNGDEEHRFTVAMDEDSEAGNYILTISNTGLPFPDDVDIENPRGLGLQLVSALVHQLQGTLELQRKPQPVFTIRFSESRTYGL